MLSEVSKYILNVNHSGTSNMREGIIPFGSSDEYGLTEEQIKDLHSSRLTSPNEELNARRITAMAGRAKALMMGLFGDVAKFAKTPLEGFNLILALKKGLTFGFEAGEQLATSILEPHSPITPAS